MTHRQPAPLRARAVRPPIHVLVVDDSTVVRGMLRVWLEDEPQIRSVAVARHGVEALHSVAIAVPDVIVLDIEMPELDGYSALPLLRQACPDAVIIISSNSTPRDGKIALRCLERGATEILPKPSLGSGLGVVPAYRNALIALVKGLAHTAHPVAMPARGRLPASRALAGLVRKGDGATDAGDANGGPTAARSGSGASRLAQPAQSASSESAPPDAAHRYPRKSVIVIGASTGGPQALHALLAGMTDAIARVPVAIAQHMPPVFTALLADHLRQRVGVPVREPRDGEALSPGCVYLAPGGQHLRIAGTRAHPVAAIDDGDPVRFARPSVDLLFESASAVFGSAALGLVMTGMGSDGTLGAQAIVKAGGTMLVQDEASSVVWGMPASVLKRLPQTRVVPLSEAAAVIGQIVSGSRA